MVVWLFQSVLLGWWICACAPSDVAKSDAETPSVSSRAPAKVRTGALRSEARKPAADSPGLENLLRVADGVYSGGEPDGKEGFRSLARLGVKTIVSVDGARPRLQVARDHGMRYVHVPIGYDGVDRKASDSLARLVREMPKPIYVHCHHGKHRGPAAAAIACIAAGTLDDAAALTFLERAGTSKDYRGLWRDVRSYRPPPSNAELPPLVEAADIGTLAAAMARIDRTFANLDRCRKEHWRTPSDHPDLRPAQEALILREGLREAVRNLVDKHDKRFRGEFLQAESLAGKLEAALKANRPATADREFIRLRQSCQRCHADYRN